MKYLVEELENVGVTLIAVEALNNVSYSISTNRSTLELKVINDSYKTSIRLKGLNLDNLYDEKNGHIHLSETSCGYVRLKRKTQALTNRISLVDLPDDKWNIERFKKMQGFQIACNNCKLVVLDSEVNIKKISEMPSEFWAEFMDYWHCHKPTIGESKTDAKPYDYYKELKPRLNEVLVGNTYFQTIGSTIDRKVVVQTDGSVDCSNCRSTLGYKEGSEILVLEKHNLQLQDTFKELSEDYPGYLVVLARILSLLKFNSTRYFALKTGGQKPIFIWVLAYDCSVAYTGNELVQRAYKLLYKDSWDRPPSSMEDIQLSDDLLDSFLQQLTKIHELIPENLKMFNGWKVSYMSIEDTNLI
ncbi:Uncharacterized protein AO442_004414 [Nakaseomyces glabratus]|nr:Uncharacterized protein AO443_004296 [Nakaseomyces glabratus]KTB23613.1 Uncharacterized protein AO442_004414 [Nakaseomyces glabratus]